MSQPVATLFIKGWERPGKVCLIFRAERFRLVEELNFWHEIRDTIMSSFPYGRQWAADTWIAPKNLHIDIFMLACLRAEEQIERPSASDPPGTRERGKEAGNLFRSPWLP